MVVLSPGIKRNLDSSDSMAKEPAGKSVVPSTDKGLIQNGEMEGE